MATIKNQVTGEKLARHFSTNAGVYFREWRGKMVVASKPRPRGKNLSEKQAVAVDKFKQASVLAKLAAPSQQIQADKLTKGTQYFARDLIFMCMYGTLGYLQLDDGRKLFSVAANQNVSLLIDALAQQVGEMLFRNTDGWEPIAIGNPGEVLTFQDGRPVWLPASGGAGGGYFDGATMYAQQVGVETNTAASQGTLATANAAMEVSRITAIVSPQTITATYVAVIAEMSALNANATVVEVVDTSTPLTAVSTAATLYDFDFADPKTLQPGKPYLFAITRTDGGTNDRANLCYAQGTAQFIRMNAPVDQLPGMVSYRANPLAPSDGPYLPSANRFPYLWPRGQIVPQ